MVLCFLITDQPPEKGAQIREEEGTVTLLILLPQNIIVFFRNAKYLYCYLVRGASLCRDKFYL